MRYKEFPEVLVPLWLRGGKWTDESWHNDACPASDHPLTKDRTLRVWVNFPGAPKDREVPDVWCVVTFENGALGMNDEELYTGDDEEAAKAAAQGAIAKHQAA